MFILPIILALLLISLIFAPLGCINIWQRYVYFADGLAHAALLAGSLSLIFSLDLSYSSLIVSLIFAFLVFKFKNSSGTSESISIISNFMLAAALIASYLSPSPLNMDSLLFGEILSVDTKDLFILSLILVFCILFFFAFYNQIILSSLNKDMAKVAGIKVDRIELIFLILLSLSIFSTIKIVGALLVGSILIIPASCSKFISTSPGSMILNSLIISVAVNFTGLFLSFYLDLPVAATILTAGFCLYLFFFLYRTIVPYR